MEPQDDPEARIRALERSLDARATELGMGQYGSGESYPPTLAHPSYGVPYPEASASGSGGFRAWWLVPALIAVAVVVVAAGVAIFAANMSTRDGSVTGDPGSQDVFGGGGPIDEAPARQPTVPDGQTVTIPPPGGQLSVAGVEENKTIACNDSVVSVSGVSNTVTITGNCASLTVSGMENQVTVNAADVINASGFDNVVTYRSGAPQINSGGSNVVQQG